MKTKQTFTGPLIAHECNVHLQITSIYWNDVSRRTSMPQAELWRKYSNSFNVIAAKKLLIL